MRGEKQKKQASGSPGSVRPGIAGQRAGVQRIAGQFMAPGRIRRAAERVGERVLGLLYPERCVFCDGTIFDTDEGICPECGRYDTPVTEAYCMKCGKPLLEPVSYPSAHTGSKGRGAGDKTDSRLFYIGEEYCSDCRKKTHSFDRGRCLFPYNDRTSKSIYRFKYGGRRRYAVYYGRRIAEIFSAELESWGAGAIVPVPLHRERYRHRGYNQAELLALETAKRLGLEVVTDLVERSRNTKPLKLLGPRERQENLKNAFKLCQFEVKLKTIVLFDDIYTTGSTIDEISKLLKGAGVEKVYFITAAAGAPHGA